VRRWHQDYVAALMARDLQDIAHIRRKDSMHKLLEVLAAWSGKLMDVSAIGGQLALSWRVSDPRVIGLARIPRLLVSFRFTGLDDAQRYIFMKRFDLYMQRGGG
jgi:hypothetical protein